MSQRLAYRVQIDSTRGQPESEVLAHVMPTEIRDRAVFQQSSPRRLQPIKAFPIVVFELEASTTLRGALVVRFRETRRNIIQTNASPAKCNLHEMALNFERNSYFSA